MWSNFHQEWFTLPKSGRCFLTLANHLMSLKKQPGRVTSKIAFSLEMKPHSFWIVWFRAVRQDHRSDKSEALIVDVYKFMPANLEFILRGFCCSDRTWKDIFQLEGIRKCFVDFLAYNFLGIVVTSKLYFERHLKDIHRRILRGKTFSGLYNISEIVFHCCSPFCKEESYFAALCIYDGTSPHNRRN